MNNFKYIKDWKELKEEKSLTHVLEIDLEYGCGWIRAKEEPEELGSNSYYLSTHTFYGDTYKYSTELLQSCGFNVVLANWDEIGY